MSWKKKNEGTAAVASGRLPGVVPPSRVPQRGHHAGGEHAVFVRRRGLFSYGICLYILQNTQLAVFSNMRWTIFNMIISLVTENEFHVIDLKQE